MDDREIVTAILTGDPAGLAGAYDKYAAHLYGYCRWMLHDPADAAGALQHTFVIAVTRLRGSPGSPSRSRSAAGTIAAVARPWRVMTVTLPRSAASSSSAKRAQASRMLACPGLGEDSCSRWR